MSFCHARDSRAYLPDLAELELEGKAANRVDHGDIGSIQGHLGEKTDSSNFRNDINADGRINNQDVEAARAHKRQSCQ